MHQLSQNLILNINLNLTQSLTLKKKCKKNKEEDVRELNCKILCFYLLSNGYVTKPVKLRIEHVWYTISIADSYTIPGYCYKCRSGQRRDSYLE